MNVDFQIFSSYDEALTKTRPWLYCNYNDVGVGFPRDCSKVAGECDPMSDIEMVNGSFYNKRTGMFPALLHFNGAAKSALWDASDALYPMTETAVRQLHNSSFSSAKGPVRYVDVCGTPLFPIPQGATRGDRCCWEHSQHISQHETRVCTYSFSKCQFS